MRKALKLSEWEKQHSPAERRIIWTNWGYWDGVADRQRGRLAQWYRGARASYGHFNANYAEGYNLGVFGGDPPPYAMG